jgi:hypothetical protein
MDPARPGRCMTGMRLVRGPLTVGALALVLFVPGRETSRPFSLHGPQRQTKASIGLVWRSDGARLARIDERSLRPVSTSRARLGYVGAWAFAEPGGGLLAVATELDTNDSGQFVRFVDLGSLRLIRKTVPLRGYALALLWARPDRLVAVLNDPYGGSGSIVTIDPGSRRVLSRRTLDGDVGAVARAADALVLLETPHDAIGPSRLDVVAADGTLRSVALDRVEAGTAWPQQDGVVTDPFGTQRMPALAVDPNGYRAYVVQPDGPTAEVALRTLDVAYHDLRAPDSVLARFATWLTPSASAKGLDGPSRIGTWLGDGLIAVTGADEHVVRKPDNQAEVTESPAGLAIVDTRDWSIRNLDPGADSVTAVDGLLLATGRRPTSGQQQPAGMGLAAYGPDRSLRFRLFPGASSWVVAALAGRAYVEGPAGDSSVSVVDLSSGKVVEERRGPVPTPLLVDGPSG